MVGLLINLKPLNIMEMEKKLQKERLRRAKEMAISKSLNKGIQENPIKLSKFQRD